VPAHSKRFWWILLGAGFVTVLGWETFLFTTDDAYIAFRYIEQRQLGHGYVWNGPPFLPVEGYSCFGWIVLLDGLYSLLGIAPPEGAHVLSLLASLGSLLIVARWAQTGLERRGEEGTGVYLVCVMGLLVTSRLFLTWTSSGLETALFNVVLLLWLYKGMLGGASRTPHFAVAIACASALSLVRPDGYLFVLASFALGGLHVFQGRLVLKRALLQSWPVLAVVAHVLWRKSFYGEWLPNTYYAKVVGPLPDIGLRYLLSFGIEHGLVFLFAILAIACWRTRAWWPVQGRESGWLAGGALVGHTLYYAVVAGGDHFEYRILSHWAPLMALGSVWAVLVTGQTRIIRLGGLALLALLTQSIPWIHYGVSQEHTSWSRSMPDYAIEAELPEFLSPVGKSFDELQQWLFRHGVGMRHQQHKIFSEYQLGQLPSRQVAAELLDGEENPVVVVTSAGIAGWQFVGAHVVDVFGLNDYVVARTPPRTRESARVVAHSRQPPPGYVNAFRPNMIITPARVSPFSRRESPLTDEEIMGIEQRFREDLPEDRNTPQSERTP